MKKSPITDAPQMIIESASGHLFLTGDGNKCQEQHLGKELISDVTAELWVNHLRSISRASRELDAKFCFLPAPDKQSVYWDELSVEQDNRNVKKILGGLHSSIFVDVLDELQSMRSSSDPYPKVDTHWNSLGALTAIRVVLDLWGVRGFANDFPGPFVDYEFAGDLGIKMNPAKYGVATNLRVDLWRQHLVYDNGVPDNGRMRSFHNSGAPIAGRLIVCGDSFSYRLVEVASQLFQSVFHVHAPYLNRNILKILSPQYVIFEQTERFFIRNPTHSIDVPASRIIEEKIEGGVEMGEMIRSHRNLQNLKFIDAHHALFIEMSESYLEKLGLIDEKFRSAGFDSWKRACALAL